MNTTSKAGDLAEAVMRAAYARPANVQDVVSPSDVPNALRAAAQQYRQEPAPIWHELAQLLERAAKDADRLVRPS